MGAAAADAGGVRGARLHGGGRLHGPRCVPSPTDFTHCLFVFSHLHTSLSGNWATDIAGGALFEYALLSVVLASSLLAVFLQVSRLMVTRLPP